MEFSCYVYQSRAMVSPNIPLYQYRDRVSECGAPTGYADTRKLLQCVSRLYIQIRPSPVSLPGPSAHSNATEVNFVRLLLAV